MASTMLRGLAPVLMACLLVTGCLPDASQDSLPGSIEFGTNHADHKIRHPKTNFGPRDRFAYIAHVKRYPARSRIKEYFLRVLPNGKERLVNSDSFTEPKSSKFITFKVPITKLYQFGLTPPGTFRVRLWRGTTKLAEGTFRLHYP